MFALRLVAASLVAVCLAVGSSCGGTTPYTPPGPTIGSLTVPATTATSAPFDVPSTPLFDYEFFSLRGWDLERLPDAAETFTLEGANLGSYGTPVTVTFTDPLGIVRFDEADGPVCVIDAMVHDDTTIRGTLPTCTQSRRIGEHCILDIQLEYPDGETVDAPALVELRAPPTVQMFGNMTPPFDSEDEFEDDAFWRVLPVVDNRIGVVGENLDPDESAFGFVVQLHDTTIYTDSLSDVTAMEGGLAGILPAVGPSHPLYGGLDLYGSLMIGCGIVNEDGQFDYMDMPFLTPWMSFVARGAMPNQAPIAEEGSNAGTAVAVWGREDYEDEGPMQQMNRDVERNVVVASNALDQERILVRYSYDGGTTWAATTVGPWEGPNSDFDAFDEGLEVDERRDPQLATDPWGNHYLAYFAQWQGEGDDGSCIVVLQSMDGGATWSSPTAMLVTEAPDELYLGRFGLDVGPDPFDDDAAVVAVTAARHYGEMLERKFGGADWTEIVAQAFGVGRYGHDTYQPEYERTVAGAEPDEAVFANPDIAIGPDGAAHVAFVVHYEDWDDWDEWREQFLIACSQDLDGLLETGFDFPDSPVELGVITPENAGRNLLPFWPEWSPALGEGRIILQPRLASVRGGPHEGRLLCAWTGCTSRPDEDTWKLDVYSAFSDDHGSTWSLQTLVHPPEAEADHFGVALATDPVSGHAYVSWYAEREPDDEYDDPEDLQAIVNGYPEVQRMAASAKDGYSWGEPLHLSQGHSAGGRSDLGFRYDNGLAAWGHGVWASWADNSDLLGTNPDGFWEMDVYLTVFMLLPDAGLLNPGWEEDQPLPPPAPALFRAAR